LAESAGINNMNRNNAYYYYYYCYYCYYYYYYYFTTTTAATATTTKELRGLSLRANCTDRAIAACAATTNVILFFLFG
jgi:hypothetical protein